MNLPLLPTIEVPGAEIRRGSKASARGMAESDARSFKNTLEDQNTRAKTRSTSEESAKNRESNQARESREPGAVGDSKKIKARHSPEKNDVKGDEAKYNAENNNDALKKAKESSAKVSDAKVKKAADEDVEEGAVAIEQQGVLTAGRQASQVSLEVAKILGGETNALAGAADHPLIASLSLKTPLQPALSPELTNTAVLTDSSSVGHPGILGASAVSTMNTASQLRGLSHQSLATDLPNMLAESVVSEKGINTSAHVSLSAQSAESSALQRQSLLFIDPDIDATVQSQKIDAMRNLDLPASLVLRQALDSSERLSTAAPGLALGKGAADMSQSILGQVLGNGEQSMLGQQLKAALPLSLEATTQNPVITEEETGTQARLSAALHHIGTSFSSAFTSAEAGRLQVPINISFGQQGWGTMVAERTAMLASQNLKFAELQLDPPELGPLQVKIKVTQEHATVSFIANNAQVKEALDQSAARLKELFAEQGLDLVDVDVSDRESAEAEQDDTQGRSSLADDDNPQPNDTESTATASSLQATLNYGIDSYA